MDVPKIPLLILILFYFHLSNCAPVYKGLGKNTSASNESAPHIETELYQPISANISENENTENSTDQDLPLILHGKPTFKKTAVKVKSWKNKITGGGGSNKVKNNKDGIKGGGHISIPRPFRPIKSGDDYIADYIYIGAMGLAILVGIFLGCLQSCRQKDEDENEENKNTDENKNEEENTTQNEFKMAEIDKNENVYIVNSAE